MSATRLNLEIYSHTKYFRKMFQCRAYTDSYLFFECLSRYEYKSVAIYKTSLHCYRVMWYASYLQVRKQSGYISFRSIADMCVFLDSLCDAQLNK